MDNIKIESIKKLNDNEISLIDKTGYIEQMKFNDFFLERNVDINRIKLTTISICRYDKERDYFKNDFKFKTIKEKNNYTSIEEYNIESEKEENIFNFKTYIANNISTNLNEIYEHLKDNNDMIFVNFESYVLGLLDNKTEFHWGYIK